MSTETCVYSHHARELKPEEAEKLRNENVVSDFKQNKLEVEAQRNWDLFYKRNETRFFKDRHWTKREFEEISDSLVSGAHTSQNCGSRKPVLLEVGCGVGNFIFPLIEGETKFFIHACDFSPRAINFVKENPLYNASICNAFVCDVTKEKLTNFIPQSSVDIASMIFVLSALHPDKMLGALKNIWEVLQPGGMLLFRDYGLFDQAMLRFGPGHKLGENFYVRQDGTRAFYFSEECLGQLASEAGYQIIMNNYVKRETVNCKKNICVPRIYIQGKFLKPSNVS